MGKEDSTGNRKKEAVMFGWWWWWCVLPCQAEHNPVFSSILLFLYVTSSHLHISSAWRSHGTLCICESERQKGSVLWVCVSLCHPHYTVHLIDSSLSGPSKAPFSLSSLPQKSHSHSFLFKPAAPLHTHRYSLVGAVPHKTALTLH